jgi:hypothetical protein
LGPEMPMKRAVEAFLFASGVSRVFRVSEVKRIFRRRDAAPVGVIVAMIIAFSVVVPRASAQSEDQVIAASLFNFARYVEWPENAFDRRDAPVLICMLDSKDFGDVVSDTVSGKTVDRRPVAVSQTTDILKAGGCHILFIGRGFEKSHQDAVAALGGSSVFSVADQEGFASAGGIANFDRADNRMRFEINPDAAKKAGLKISSRLLRLAQVVH